MFKLKLWLFVILFVFCGSTASSRDRNNKEYKVVCYWGQWGFYKWSYGQSYPENTNPMLCTHMMYGFAQLHETNNTIGYIEHDLCCGDTDYNSGLEWGNGLYRRFNHLREINPHLTTMISIGGWNEGSNKYSKMASNSENRKKFINSVLEFLKQYDFDGLDLDWEYPAFKAIGGDNRTIGNLEDKGNFIKLVEELKSAFKPHGYVLSVAVSAGRPTIDRGYDVKQLSDLSDFINVMSYDFHGAWENKTAHNAPLYASPDANERDKQFTVQYGIDYWLKLGADPKKIIMGVPLYGRTFTLLSSEKHGLRADADGVGGDAGLFTQQAGVLGYFEICIKLKTKEWTVYRDNFGRVPYAVKGKQWIGFDDIQSIKEKLAFLKSRKLGGAVAWSIEMEDFTDVCGGGKYPIMKTISGELNGITGPDPVIHEIHVTKNPHISTSELNDHVTTDSINNQNATNKSVTGQFKCEISGYFADPKEKTIFHQCVDTGNSKFKDFVINCPNGLIYEQKEHICKNP